MAKKILTHIDAEGKARMVDVSEKSPTARRAVADALCGLSVTLSMLSSGLSAMGGSF